MTSARRQHDVIVSVLVLIGGVPHGGVTDMWPWSTVNVDWSMANTGQASTGLVGPGFGQGLARHVAHASAATSSYWATNGP